MSPAEVDKLAKRVRKLLADKGPPDPEEKELASMFLELGLGIARNLAVIAESPRR